MHRRSAKRRLKFLGHIKRSNPDRLAKQIVEFYESRSKADRHSEINQRIKKRHKLGRNTQKDIQNQEIFRSKINKWQIEQEGSNRRKIPKQLDLREERSPQQRMK